MEKEIKEDGVESYPAEWEKYINRESYTDEYGAYVDARDNMVSSTSGETCKYLEDVNIQPSFWRIKAKIVFGLARLFNMDVGYLTPYRRNIKGKYYSRIDGRLYKNV